MRDHSIPNGLCCVDPVTLALGALTTVASGAASSMFSGGGGGGNVTNVTQAPEAPPPQAPPQRSPTGQKKVGGATPTSFIGSAAAAPQPSIGGGKTLLGQ